MDGLDDIVREFLVESHDNLDQLDSDLVALEKAPGSRDLLGSVFRTIHTIKGTSGFLAFGALERVTHAGESLLVELRDGKRSMDGPTTDVLLRMVDAVRAILASIEATGTEGDVSVDDVVAQITAVLAAGAPLKRRIKRPTPVAEPVVEPVAELVAEAVAEAVAEPVAVPVGAALGQAGDDDAWAPVMAVEPLAAPLRSARDHHHEPPVAPDPASSPGLDAVPEPRRPEPTHPEPTHHEAAHHEQAHDDLPHADDEPGDRASLASAMTGRSRGAADASIRVDVDLLDALMRQVSELVLARNTISRLAEGDADLELTRAAQRLSLIASELQEGVMKTRMQPIEQVWQKVPRMVRDLASACGRQVALDMSGGDTELDRSLLEAIKDPLTHLVRNAVDHGIEDPDVRLQAGKPAQGTLALHAFHAGGQVVVEVSDDGAGIDTERVAATAVRRGLKTAEQTAAMSPAELLQLLFLPGFSTATEVTNVSGRGVGMDVVRTKIESIGGTVDVESTLGTGTTWRLRIPLTLAILPALTVECAGNLYEIPQVSLLELVALGGHEGDIEYVRSSPVYRLRGELLPLADLREVFAVGPREPGHAPVIAVLQADTRRFGLLVDRVLNTEEIVVKPLSSHLKSIGLYAGATLLGDGRVALIVDVPAIARRVMPDVGEADRTAAVEETVRRVIDQVLVAGVDGHLVAIPLASVTRLERLPSGVVEHVGGREVVQYRGAITPLVRLDRMLGGAGRDTDGELTVVVSTRGARSVAIVVDHIVDIVDDDAEQHSDVGGGVLLGSTVLKDRVTELLDVRAAVTAADPLFYAEADDARLDLVGV